MVGDRQSDRSERPVRDEHRRARDVGRARKGAHAMIVTRKAIPRRTMLRGLGATLALPLLDGMIPAFTAQTRTATPVHRFGVMYVVNGMIMDRWTPASDGRGYELTPTLASLSKHRERMSVLTHLACVPSP